MHTVFQLGLLFFCRWPIWICY